MNKILEIRVKDSEFGKYIGQRPCIYPIECTHIANSFKDEDINYVNAHKAIDFLIAYFAKNGYEYTVVDINARNILHAPAKEMTIEEIEEELGYKVKIVKEKEVDE